MDEKRKPVEESFKDAYNEYFFGNSSSASGNDRLRALHHQLRFWQESERYVSKVGFADLHHEGVLDTYRERVTKAIIDWNQDFFREVAEAMDFVEHKELDPLRFVLLSALWLLIARVPAEVTKRKVRQLALRWWAIERLRRRYAHVEKQLPYFVHHEAPPEIEREIRKEVEGLPKQDWTDLFKKAGLRDLPADPGGSPTHES
jgi:hypothetical protein